MKVTEVVSGTSAGTLIHKAVFGRLDAPPPYSTDHKIAEWLMESFNLYAEPIRDMKVTDWDESSGLRWGDVLGYMVCSRERIAKSEGEEIYAEIGLASADTFPLAACRTVLLLKQVVEDTPGHLSK